MVAQLETHQGQQDDPIEKTKSLICALNFVSRNLPLPPDVYDSVSSIYYGEHDPAIEPSGCGSQTAGGSDRTEVADKVLDNGRISSTGDLLSEFEDALSRQRPKCASGSELSKSREILYRSHIQHRLHELEGQHQPQV
ncbi:probable ATP-dependent DNA helicase CHR12 [Carica papaya]|uniref:probable ATP-dependent DNA helicase CHR12 n=1 Tax=Carica papaya TaxID=3649 RepID=UPI000B8D0741|nr:probable ATP-dependent DNA helicase CHR12 [Carica papaya]